MDNPVVAIKAVLRDNVAMRNRLEQVAVEWNALGYDARVSIGEKHPDLVNALIQAEHHHSTS